MFILEWLTGLSSSLEVKYNVCPRVTDWSVQFLVYTISDNKFNTAIKKKHEV